MPQQASTQAAPQAPTTRAELDALRAQRTELMGQQHELGARRAELMAQEHIGSDAEARAIQDQIRQLDQRNARLDAQITRLNDQISTAVGRGVSRGGEDVAPALAPITIPQISIPPMGPFGPMGQARLATRQLAGSIAAEGVTFLLLGFVFWQFGWKRMRAQLAQALGDQSARVQQLQQAVDVIGIEVERISEGQRYVAKMLTEGSAQPVSAPPVRSVLSQPERR